LTEQLVIISAALTFVDDYWRDAPRGLKAYVHPCC